MAALDPVAFEPRGRRVIAGSIYITRLQRRHFLVFDALPNFMAVVALLSLTIIPFRWGDAIVLIAMWAITGLGITVGYHRLFTHRAFLAKPGVRTALAICGALAGQGPVISWSAIHRRHHELSDELGDPHSPNLHGNSLRAKVRGLVHSHFTWMIEHEYPNAAHYVPDLLRDKAIVGVNKYYYRVALAGLLVPGLLASLIDHSWLSVVAGVLWGGFFRMALLGNTIWAINSILHVAGHRRFSTSDHSHNFGLIALLTFGESWHNNHHAFPYSAKFGIGRGWSDPGWWLVHGLERLGLAQEVRQPTQAVIAQHAQRTAKT